MQRSHTAAERPDPVQRGLGPVRREESVTQPVADRDRCVAGTVNAARYRGLELAERWILSRLQRTAIEIDEALDAKAKGEKRVILFNLSGHGLLDLSSFESYLHGKIQDV